MKKEVYILNIVDDEDGYIYYSLLFNSIEDVWTAEKILIDEGNEWYNKGGKWYHKKDNVCIEKDDYAKKSIELLNACENLHYTILDLNIAKIYIRQTNY